MQEEYSWVTFSTLKLWRNVWTSWKVIKKSRDVERVMYLELAGQQSSLISRLQASVRPCPKRRLTESFWVMTLKAMASTHMGVLPCQRRNTEKWEHTVKLPWYHHTRTFHFILLRTFNQTVGTFDELQKYLEGYVANLNRDDEKRHAK